MNFGKISKLSLNSKSQSWKLLRYFSIHIFAKNQEFIRSSVEVRHKHPTGGKLCDRVRSSVCWLDQLTKLCLYLKYGETRNYNNSVGWRWASAASIFKALQPNMSSARLSLLPNRTKILIGSDKRLKKVNINRKLQSREWRGQMSGGSNKKQRWC